jgi:hypothetical protein
VFGIGEYLNKYIMEDSNGIQLSGAILINCTTPSIPPPIITNNLKNSIIIDNFEEGEQTIFLAIVREVTAISAIQMHSIYTSVSGSESINIFGGERDLEVVLQQSSSNKLLYSEITYGDFHLRSDTEVFGHATIQYDGIDGTMNLQVNGLVGINGSSSGVDLKKIGVIGFEFVATTSAPFMVLVNIYSPDSSMCVGAIMIDHNYDSASNYYLYFSDFIVDQCDLEI